MSAACTTKCNMDDIAAAAAPHVAPDGRRTLARVHTPEEYVALSAEPRDHSIWSMDYVECASRQSTSD